MDGKEMKRIRRELGLTVIEFGRALGYVSASADVSRTVRRYESGDRVIPLTIARLARALPDLPVDEFIQEADELAAKREQERSEQSDE